MGTSHSSEVVHSQSGFPKEASVKSTDMDPPASLLQIPAAFFRRRTCISEKSELLRTTTTQTMAPNTKTARDARARTASKSRQGPVFDPASEDEMQLTTAPQHNGVEDDDSSSEEEGSVDIIMDDDASSVASKDESEEELERLVFGDTAGFRAGLQDFALDASGAAYEDESDEDDEEGDIKDVPDQDLFFFDSGPQAVEGAIIPIAKTDGEEEDEEDGKPVWVDSDDERVIISLASVPRLRKLRETEEDDMVNGKEYVRRLRRQYQSLYPTPDWALEATGKAKRKRTRALDDEESEDDSVSEMDEDEEGLSTQPLARLLKDADILSRASRGSIKKRKLQPGAVDIQRLKDVSKRGPVCLAFLPCVDFGTLLTCFIVCRYITFLPPYVSSPPLLRPELDTLVAPRQSQFP